ncbi:MAG TPA: phytanoyl-CoA dioxygenase family protein [Spirochaetia bacterium]|nr:phytanoyl-CoA dioxygenase family protein [Spirochaetia bacterium]
MWLRAKKPGIADATAPHYDVVFMGRGTRRLYTAWTPLEDVPLEKGGLMILEGSHLLSDVRSTYGELDVDTYCANKSEARDIETGKKQWEDRVNGGKYADDALAVREALGGRWLTSDFHAGDVLLFSMYTMHASSDNHSRSYRLSTDTRYQLASEPVDERWIGKNPPAHGPGGKRGMIC